MRHQALLLLSMVALCTTSSPAFQDSGEGGRRVDQEALRPLSGLVGEWRGVGQVQRNSSKGSWREAGIWRWKLDAKHAALDLVVEDGRFLKSLVISRGAKPGDLVLDVTTPEGKVLQFSGRMNDREQLIATAAEGQESGLQRLTLSPLHDTRFLLLYEGRERKAGPVARLGEVGFTRQGVAFAAGDAAPVCIVTEGRGSIPVKHKGQTYYVCCSGCKDLFDADPEGVLAEARARKAGDVKK